MNTLFDIAPKFPEGFYYYPDFISIREEEELILQISKIQLHPFIFQGFEAKRKVASFGYDYNFNKASLSKGGHIPEGFESLRMKISEVLSISPEKFAEVLVTEYPVGSVINWHRDAPPFEIIAGISLFSDCMFRLKPYEKVKQTRASILSFPVHRRSLYIISGHSRSEWQHSIAPVKDKRYSITFRTLKDANFKG